MDNRQLLTAFAAVQQLGSITRFSKDTIVNKESVLEHTGFVALFSYIMASHLDDPSLKWDVLMCRAVVHDLDEIYVGDVARITKYATPTMTQEFKQLEQLAIRKLNEDLYMPNFRIGNDWLNAKADDLEGTIIRAADMTAVVYKAWQEIALSGNSSVVRIALELSANVIPAFIDRINRSCLLSSENKSFFLIFADNALSLCYQLAEKCNASIADTLVVATLTKFNMTEGKS